MTRFGDRSAGGGPDLPRLFVAVPVPGDVGAAVERVILDARRALGDEARRIRWVQVDGLIGAQGIAPATDPGPRR